MSEPLIAKRQNIVTARADRQNVVITENWSVSKIKFNSNIKIGNKLTVESNAIKIGKGIKKILASAQCGGIGNSLQGDKNLFLQKNNATFASTYQSADATGGFLFASIPPCLVGVSEGDMISLGISSGTKGTLEILGGYITVEVVE